MGGSKSEFIALAQEIEAFNGTYLKPSQRSSAASDDASLKQSRFSQLVSRAEVYERCLSYIEQLEQYDGLDQNDSSLRSKLMDDLNFVTLKYEPDHDEVAYINQNVMNGENFSNPLCRIREDDKRNSKTLSIIGEDDEEQETRSSDTSQTAELKSPVLSFPEESLHSFCFSPPGGDLKLMPKYSQAQNAPSTALRESYLQNTPVSSNASEAMDSQVPANSPQPRSAKSLKAKPFLPPLRVSKTPETASITSPILPIHSPTRFSQPKNALLTTNEKGLVIIANEIMLDLLQTTNDQLINSNVLDIFAKDYRKKQEQIYEKGKNADKKKRDVVLQCGAISRLKVKKDSVPVAVWTKKKALEDSNEFVYLWVFEFIQECQVEMEFDSNGEVVSTKGPYHELFELPDEQKGNLKMFLPALRSNTLGTEKFFEDNKYSAAVTARGSSFPVILRLKGSQSKTSQCVDLISLPAVSGAVTVSSDGTIMSCNSSFIKFLFGYSTSELIKKVNVSLLLPHFKLLKEEVDRISTLNLAKSPVRSSWNFSFDQRSEDSENGTQGMLLNTHKGLAKAVHKQGIPFEVDVFIRRVQDRDQVMYALWISFERKVAIEPEQKDKLLKSSDNLSSTASPSMQKKTNEKEPSSAVLNQLQGLQIKEEIQRSNSIQKTDDLPPSNTVTTRKFADYDLLQKLGEGAFGHVHLAKIRSLPHSKPIVLKVVSRRKILKESWTQDSEFGFVPKEVQILNYLGRFDHPNITKLSAYFQDPNNLYMEFQLHGTGRDLFDYIEHTNMTEQEMKYIFKQTTEAILFLHEHKIVHRDIKDENIVIDHLSRIQLIDFGSAAWVTEFKQFTTFCGTIDYCSPEVLSGNSYTGKPQDMWAMGILLYTLVYRENPFANVDEIMGRELRIPFIMSQQSLNLIQLLLRKKPERRPTADEVLKHPWLLQ